MKKLEMRIDGELFKATKQMMENIKNTLVGGLMIKDERKLEREFKSI
ncbi:MAG: hypothetical protein QXY52_04780 [Conexivisphaerales archaeon]